MKLKMKYKTQYKALNLFLKNQWLKVWQIDFYYKITTNWIPIFLTY